ncbi:MAG: 3-hydroxy-5-phosphonooxypentane-2,4-dione thiolase, partial [Candidatus Nitrosotalea sp.]|nr:3-hydroxy-5-phosphonooxypentane-2,4-dione thiolase [Candidatus Nitrosotalea sp.]
ENFEKVVTSCPVPVIIAGGSKLATELDVFNLTYDALQAGASGGDMGRNIWQNDHPVAMIKAVRAIVHQKVTVKEANEIFKKIKSESPEKIKSAQKSKSKKVNS